VGKEVRVAIQRIGGTMPEDIQPVEHIKQVEKRLKSAPAKLKLEDKDAKGLAGNHRLRLKSQAQNPSRL
jgi:DNA-damage-inducible protein D